MSHLYFVRHGRAEAGWDVSADPSLDEVGRAQATTVADKLASAIEPCAIYTSPLARCRETAACLAAKWGTSPILEPAIAEIPSPEGVALVDRGQWLRAAMGGRWADLSIEHRTYRDDLVRFALGVGTPAVLFTHFVAVNVLIGHVLGTDDLLTKGLDNCSVTVFERLAEGGLGLVEYGHEADTLIR